MHYLAAIAFFAIAPSSLAAPPCWQRAADESRVDVTLLRGIASAESSLRTDALNTSHEHITGTRDVGLAGVNNAPAVLKRLGVSESDLFDPCINLRTGARILREKFDRYGVTWEAVGAYNASCTRLKGDACTRARTAYAWRVYHAMHPTRGRSFQANSAASSTDRLRVPHSSLHLVSLR